MLTHTEQKMLPYSPEQMFDLVAAVDRYQDFLPWCIASRINKREGDVFYADLVIGYKMLREKFSSRVVTKRPDYISVEYLSGPLKHLKNEWRFSPAEGKGCRIDFYVEFDFTNPVLRKLLELFFHEAIKRMVSAFEERAEEIYGRP